MSLTFPISLSDSSIVKSGNKIGKVNDKKKSDNEIEKFWSRKKSNHRRTGPRCSYLNLKNSIQFSTSPLLLSSWCKGRSEHLQNHLGKGQQV